MKKRKTSTRLRMKDLSEGTLLRSKSSALSLPFYKVFRGGKGFPLVRIDRSWALDLGNDDRWWLDSYELARFEYAEGPW